MSLYDKYFSKINEEHMYGLIQTIILEETGKNIKKENRLHNIFKERYPLVFSENNVETLKELNKLLIDDICGLIIKNIKGSLNIDNPPLNIDNPPLNIDTGSEFLERSEYFMISSRKRKSQSLNRFNYSVDFEGKSILIDKLVIPFENNIFISNDLMLKINNELIYLECKSKNKVDKREYLTFEPYHKKRITISENYIDIKIVDELEREKKDKDIYLINTFKNIKIKDKDYLCISLDNYQEDDFSTDDTIGLINDDKMIDITKILFKTDIFLLCELVDTMVVSHIINLSLQNKIYCEKS